MATDTTTPEFPPIPQNKAELLALIDQTRSEFEQTVGARSDEQLTAPAPGGWSVKDHLAHLAVWEQSLLALLEGRSRPAAMGLDPAAYAEHDEDALNETLYQLHKDRPLPEVMAMFRQSHEQLLAVLAGLTDDDLFKPYSAYQPDDPPYNAAPVIGWIAGNTYEHFMLHKAYIQPLIAS